MRLLLPLLGLVACAPDTRPGWTSGEDLDPESYTAPAGTGSTGDTDGSGADSGSDAATDGCADLEGTWTFDLTVTAGDCAIPTPLSYSQTVSCGDDGAFSLTSGNLSAECFLEGASFGCHTPDPEYNFALTGSIGGDSASGTWTWRFPSACDSVSGTFVATR